MLNVISKVYEKIMAEQITAFFIDKMHASISAYRKGYSCQHVLLQMTELWRQSLDEGKNVASIAMDLSKAFDSMPHGLLLAKLHAYGFSLNACKLVTSYLRNRRQRVKANGAISDWQCINIGVPQGSVLGPLLFNIFINDLFFIPLSGQVFNYADDNTLSNSNVDITKLYDSMLNDSSATLAWFDDNALLANPGKFQALVLGKQRNELRIFVLQGHSIDILPEMKVLGVCLDSQLNFNSHISSICKKASQQLNALRRISKFLSKRNRLLIYKSFMRSTFDYCPIVWIFCGKTNSYKLEKLQERAFRVIYQDTTSSYEGLLQNAGLLPLRLYRIRCLLIEVFKCIHGNCPEYLNNLFEVKRTVYDMRSNCQLVQKRFNSMKYGFRSFQYYGSKVWNSLPLDIKCLTDFNLFKKRLCDGYTDGYLC